MSTSRDSGDPALPAPPAPQPGQRALARAHLGQSSTASPFAEALGAINWTQTERSPSPSFDLAVWD